MNYVIFESRDSMHNRAIHNVASLFTIRIQTRNSRLVFVRVNGEIMPIPIKNRTPTGLGSHVTTRNDNAGRLFRHKSPNVFHNIYAYFYSPLFHASETSAIPYTSAPPSPYSFDFKFYANRLHGFCETGTIFQVGINRNGEGTQVIRLIRKKCFSQKYGFND